MQAEPRTGSGGYVTLAVLVIAGVLAGFVSTLLRVSRPALDLARIGADELASESMIDGGLTAAGFLLFKAEREPHSVDGATLKFANGSVQLAVLDEGGRIDLNSAAPELLAGLFSAAGGSSLPPESFAARIVDWRDEDAETGEGGAEAEAYGEAGIGYGPRNGPFRSPEELRLLIGLSARDYGRLAPLVTVYNRDGLIDPLSASKTVLLAVPGIGRADVENLIKARLAGTRDREALAAMVSGAEGFLGTEPSGAYRVRLRARLKTGFGDAAEAVITAPADQSSDFGVVAWSRVRVDDAR